MNRLAESDPLARALRRLVGAEAGFRPPAGEVCVEPLPSWLSAPAEVVSTLKVLVCQPDTGWPVGMGDPQGIDPLDPDHEPRLKMAMRVVAEVKKAEARFRLQAQANVEVAGGQAQEEH